MKGAWPTPTGQTESLWHDLLTITAERDALRERVADLERRLADLSRMVVAAEVEDE